MAAPVVYLPDGSAQILSGRVGDIIMRPSDQVPAHCLECNGAAISRSAYPELFDVIGTVYGAGDGSTTFNLPDLRGMFLRGVGGNSAALGEPQGDAIRNITGFFGSVGSSNDGAQTNGVFWGTTVGYTGYGTAGYQVNINLNASRIVPVAAENRPVNMSVMFCIVYE